MRITVRSGKTVRTAEIAVKPKMTVGHALAAMGIALGVLDRVTPDAAALARDGMTAQITRVSNRIEKRRVAIPAQTRYVPSTKIKAGTTQTIQQPQSGHLEISERVWVRDGKITKREKIGQRIAAQPQHRIIAMGTYSHLMPNALRPHRRYASALAYRGGSPRNRGARGNFSAASSPQGMRIVKSLQVKSTGYSAGPAGGAIGNWTATGVRCTLGAVAVDPRVIPLGSKLYIPGYGYGFACDTGGAIKGRRIDLAFNSPRAAFRHGRRNVTVHILAP